ncbi:MAG: DNA primase [Flavobacteriia bacterium]|nr:DNA primase [Flavobacteriia bacterium]
MSKIPPFIIEEIMQTSRIEEVIGEFVQLKRAGSNLKGLSPFTDEKTASFVVSPAKQIFKCFSTGKGGTVVSFLMEKEHYSYPEALRWLAEKYGIEIPNDVAPTAEELAQNTERDSLFIINEFAREYFAKNLLHSEEGQAIGLSYFEERGFRRDIIEKFQLGYCFNKADDFTKTALGKGYKLEYLESVGLTKSKEEKTFDFFRGRVIFPIQSISGRVLGFGARTLQNDKKIAKYFNSPDSIVYNKSQILYGLFFAKGDITKYDECLLCEGYTDVISMHQAGIQNVVSSSGTSLTKEQIKLISRYTKNITILFDGDAAGIKASFRGIDLILEEGMNVKVVLFPDGEDPDSYAKGHSTDETVHFLAENKKDFISFKASVLLAEGINDPLHKANMIKEIIHSVSLIPDNIIRNIYAKELSTHFDIDENLVSNELIRLRKNTLAKELNEPSYRELKINDGPVAKPVHVVKENFFYELELIRIMLQFGTREINTPKTDEIESKKITVAEMICLELGNDELSFREPLCHQIHEHFVKGINDGIIYSIRFFQNLEDQLLVNFISSLDSFESELSPNWILKFNIQTKTEDLDLLQTVSNLLANFKYHKVNEHILLLQDKLKNSTVSHEDILLILAEQMAYERVKKELTGQLGRIILR